MKYQTKTLAWLLAGTLFLSAAGSSSVPNVKAADITPAAGANIVLKASPATSPAIAATTPAISASPSVSPSATPGTTPSTIPSASPSITPSATPSASPLLTTPTTPVVSAIRGGSKRVKLYWNKINGVSGYNIYYSTSPNGTYTLAKKISGNSTVKYVKTGLNQKQTYYFKMTSYVTNNGYTTESAFTKVLSAKTVSVSSTSKGAKKYANKTKFKKSAAYKKYKALSSYMTYSKSFAIPGLKNTNVAGFASKTMIPKAICQAGGYMLVSAYDSTKKDESVIYILNRASHSYITTLVLPNKANVSCMAYDGKNIWISKGDKVAYFPFSAITKAVTSGGSYSTLNAYTRYFAVQTKVNIMTYYNNTLWIGATNNTASSKMYGYSIVTQNNLCYLTSKYTMAIPSRTTGVAFDKNGYMYMTVSYATNSSKTNYISKLYKFKPDLNAPNKSNQILKGSKLKTLTLPPKAENVCVYGSYLYTIYSGSMYSSCKYPVDRVVATKLSSL